MELPPEHVVRLMTDKDFKQVLAIWADSEMYQAENSLSTWIMVDPEGLYVASTREGHILGTCCAVFSKDDLAFFGLYAVRKEYRGKGVGGKILQAALNHLRGLNCALNTAEAHLLTYRDRAGFKLQSGWISLVCHAICGQNFDQNVEKLLKNHSVNIVPVNTDVLTDQVVKYDESIHGYNRKLVVTLSLKESDSLATVAIDGKGKVKGYGLMRRDVTGYAGLGPLYADDQVTAEHLAYELIKSYHFDGQVGFLFMGFKNNPGSRAIIEKLELVVDDVCERLFTKELVPIPDMSKVFAQHDLNFCSF